MDYMNVDLDKIYTSQDFPLGARYADNDGRVFRFVKYNDGDGEVVGVAGQLVIGLDSAYPDGEVTMDYSSATIKAIANDARGFLQAALTDGAYGWVQTWGRNRKAALTGTGIDAQGEQVMKHATTDGAIDTWTAGEVLGTALEVDATAAQAVGTLQIKIAS